MASAGTNIFMGFLSALGHAITKILIPYMIFTSLAGVEFMGLQIYTEEKVQTILYWAISIGIISTAFAFFTGSSPKYSVRKAIGQIFLLFSSLFYMYVYAFAGAAKFEDLTINLGPGLSVSAILDFNSMIYLSMGMIGLNMIVNLYDLIIAIVSPIEEKKTQSKSGGSAHPKKDLSKYQYSYMVNSNTDTYVKRGEN